MPLPSRKTPFSRLDSTCPSFRQLPRLALETRARRLSQDIYNWRVACLMTLLGKRYFPDTAEPDIVFAKYLLANVLPESQLIEELPMLNRNMRIYTPGSPKYAYERVASSMHTDINAFIDHNDSRPHEEIWHAFRLARKDINRGTSPQDIVDIISKHMEQRGIFDVAYGLVFHIELQQEHNEHVSLSASSIYNSDKYEQYDNVMKAIGLVEKIISESGFDDYDDIISALSAKADYREPRYFILQRNYIQDARIVSVPLPTWIQFYEMLVLIARAADQVECPLDIGEYEERGIIEDCIAIVAGVPFADVTGE